MKEENRFVTQLHPLDANVFPSEERQQQKQILHDDMAARRHTVNQQDREACAQRESKDDW